MCVWPVHGVSVCACVVCGVSLCLYIWYVFVWWLSLGGDVHVYLYVRACVCACGAWGGGAFGRHFGENPYHTR